VGSAQTVTLSVPVSSSGTAVTATCGSESLSLGTFTSGKGVVFYNGDGTHSCKADAAISSLSDNVACIDLTNSSKDYSSTTLSANPNCIYLFGSSASVPSNFNGKNVVKGTTADNISLQDGYDFYSPISFTATKIIIPARLRREQPVATTANGVLLYCLSNHHL
jgi:dipeptidyl aminopeptidase/acylaminoacyl peptidase